MEAAISILMSAFRQDHVRLPDDESAISSFEDTTHGVPRPTDTETRVLARDAAGSWAKLPTPPLYHSEGTILELMLSAPAYEFGPDTITWPRATHDTIKSMWYISVKPSRRGQLSVSPSMGGPARDKIRQRQTARRSHTALSMCMELVSDKLTDGRVWRYTGLMRPDDLLKVKRPQRKIMYDMALLQRLISGTKSRMHLSEARRMVSWPAPPRSSLKWSVSQA